MFAKSTEKNIIATLAVMENQLLQSLDHQKNIREELSFLVKELNEITLKISTLEQTSNTCDKQVFEAISKIEKEINELKTDCNSYKKTVDSHEQFILKLKADEDNRQSIKHKVTAGVLQYIAIALVGLLGIGVVVYLKNPPTPTIQNR